MSPLTFTLREAPPAGVDVSALTPDRLAGRSPEKIRRLRLHVGRRRMAVATLFDVEGDDPDVLVFRRATGALHGVGRGMSAGSIEVRGDVGHELGREMRGGQIRVRGAAGDYAGAAMAGGHIDIGGGAGDFLAAGWPGEPVGMRGGSIRVRGDAGERVGDVMRRGLVIVEGGCGAHCGSRMIAGTVIVLGAPGPAPGTAMRRGTLLFAGVDPDVPATFNPTGKVELGYLALLVRHAAGISRKLRPHLRADASVRRWVGDMGALGKGEIIVLG